MKKLMLSLFFVVLFAVFAVPAFAKTERGEATDPNATWLGIIKYLGNSAGYHFWFTPTETHGNYTAGHTYHNIYKFELEDASDWCPSQATVPNRAPYNLVASPGKRFGTRFTTQPRILMFVAWNRFSNSI